MKTYIISCLIFFISISEIFGQKIDGYVILNSGDTINGQIKNKGSLVHQMMYESVIFYDENGQRTRYDEDEIQGYKIGKDEYFVIPFKKGRFTEKIIAKRIVSGYCELYENWFVTPGASSTGSRNQRYFLKKEGELPHLYNFRKIKRGKDLYFLDASKLNFDIQYGKYKKNDIKEIVQRYNQEYNN